MLRYVVCDRRRNACVCEAVRCQNVASGFQCYLLSSLLIFIPLESTRVQAASQRPSLAHSQFRAGLSRLDRTFHVDSDCALLWFRSAVICYSGGAQALPYRLVALE